MSVSEIGCRQVCCEGAEYLRELSRLRGDHDEHDPVGRLAQDTGRSGSEQPYQGRIAEGVVSVSGEDREHVNRGGVQAVDGLEGVADRGEVIGELFGANGLEAHGDLDHQIGGLW